MMPLAVLAAFQSATCGVRETELQVRRVCANPQTLTDQEQMYNSQARLAWHDFVHDCYLCFRALQGFSSVGVSSLAAKLLTEATDEDET
jgi:hypothetical protein